MFDPTRFSLGGSDNNKDNDKNNKQIAYRRIEEWGLQLITNPILRQACMLSVQEVICGDPNCAPVDTIIAFTYEKSQGMLRLPKPSDEVTMEDMKEMFPPEDIFQKWYNGEDAEWPPEPELEELRFDLGQEVLCRVGPTDWVAGTVVQLWYREKTWPEFVFAPYKILLQDGRSIFAPQDVDQIIRLNPNATSSSNSK